VGEDFPPFHLLKIFYIIKKTAGIFAIAVGGEGFIDYTIFWAKPVSMYRKKVWYF
jgi:hypothetical protein